MNSILSVNCVLFNLSLQHKTALCDFICKKTQQPQKNNILVEPIFIMILHLQK